MVTAISPYLGLRPYQQNDSTYFFGRYRQIEEIVRRLQSHRIVTVIGASGSGKSSLVLAGAIPHLRTSSIRHASSLRSGGNFWVPVVTTPGTNSGAGINPIRQLAVKFCNGLIKLDDIENENRLLDCENLLRVTD
jgi:energy-coupling factor transporter ATP-binding protein EcfA2